VREERQRRVEAGQRRKHGHPRQVGGGQQQMHKRETRHLRHRRRWDQGVHRREVEQRRGMGRRWGMHRREVGQIQPNRLDRQVHGRPRSLGGLAEESRRSVCSSLQGVFEVGHIGSGFDGRLRGVWFRGEAEGRASYKRIFWTLYSSSSNRSSSNSQRQSQSQSRCQWHGQRSSSRSQQVAGTQPGGSRGWARRGCVTCWARNTQTQAPQ
jgi:hypothetical protein